MGIIWERKKNKDEWEGDRLKRREERLEMRGGNW